MNPPLELHDLVAPQPVSLVPQTIGWWIAAGLLLAGIAAATIAIARHRRANRYRREALARLRAIATELADPGTRAAAAARLPVLVKQTALAVRPRTEVAGLTGPRWLAFLDASGGGRDFREGPGRLLATLAYAPAATLGAVSPEDLQALVSAVGRWIRRHRVRL